MTCDRRIPDDPRADTGLWDLVAAVPVPPAGDDFLPRLAARLDDERAEASGALLPGPPARAGRRFPARLFIAAATVAAAAAILAFAVLPAMRGTDTATAANMLASMNASAGARIVRLTIAEGVEGGASPSPSSDADSSSSWGDGTTRQLTLSTSGDVRYTMSATQEIAGLGTVKTHSVQTYDELRHEMRDLGTVVPDDGASVLVIERPSWGSDIFDVRSFAYFTALASSVRARLAEGDPNAPVSKTTYLGRPAWHAYLEERMPASDEYPDGIPVRWSVVVDMATGLLMESRMKLGSGTEVSDATTIFFRVTRIEVDPQLPEGWQSVPKTAQKRIGTYDVGTRFGTLESVARRTWPTLVLAPEWVPSGYRLTDVAATDFEGMRKSRKDKSRLIYLSRHDPREYHWKMTSVDASVQRVLVRYRRGFSTFTVEIKPLVRRGGVNRGYGSSRVGAGHVTLTDGYLKGKRARTYIAPFLGRGPTLNVRSDRSAITITGDLTRQELIDVANSFRAYGDVHKPLPAGYGE